MKGNLISSGSIRKREILITVDSGVLVAGV